LKASENPLDTNFLEQKARDILELNFKIINHPENTSQTISYTCPHKDFFPYQHLEYSCFHIIVNSHVNLERAKKEFIGLFFNQSENGNFKRINIWNLNQKEFSPLLLEALEKQDRHSLTINPLVAHALKAIHDKERNMEFLTEFLSRSKKFYDYLLKARINQTRNPFVLKIYHPWEWLIEKLPVNEVFLKNTETRGNSEEKNRVQMIKKPIFNKKSNHELFFNKKDDRLFHEDIIFNSLFIQDCKDLAFLHGELKQNGEKRKLLKIASELTNSLIKYYWKPDIGLFNNALEENIFGAPIKSATSFIPLIIDDLPIPIAATLVEDHLLNENEFWTKNPVPLIAIDENQQYFNENYWRISMPRIVINWLIIKGLFNHGFINVALELVQKTLNMVRTSGFREAYHYKKNRGFGIENFTLSTLIIDLIHISKSSLNDLDFLMDKEWTKIKRLPNF